METSNKTFRIPLLNKARWKAKGEASELFWGNVRYARVNKFWQYGKDTSNEQYRVHFPGSIGTNISTEACGYSELELHAMATRENWRVSKKVLDMKKQNG